jgi:HEAT repeat protein
MMLWWTYQQLRSSNLKTRLSVITKLAESRQPDSVEPLLFALKDKETEIRSAAALALGQFQDKRVVEPLITMLRDPVPLARATAAEALGQLREPGAMRWLISLLRDVDATVRVRAASSLERLGWQPASEDERSWFMVATGDLNRLADMGSDGIQPLVDLMRNGTPEKQLSAVKALSEIDDPRILKLMLEALKKNSAMVRLAALEKLEQLADPSTYDAVERLLHDQGSNIRAVAVSTAVSCGGSRAVPALVKMLKDTSWEVRHAVVKALGKVGDATAIDGLSKALQDRDHDVRESAAAALGKIGGAQAIRPLVLALMDVESFVRSAAHNSLGGIDPHWEKTAAARSALPQIKAALKSREYWISHSAARLLEQIPDNDSQSGIETALLTPAPELIPISHPAKNIPHPAFAILVDLLRDRDRDLRLTAAEAFGQLREKNAAPNLATAVQDGDVFVRQAAEWALVALS